MRRLILEEPVSRAALWSRRLGAFALAVAGLAILLSRVNAVDPVSALSVFGAALVLACVAALLSVTAATVIWRTGRRGSAPAALGLIMALALLAWPARLLIEAVALPPLNDVSTDPDNPVAFMRNARAIEARGGRTPPDPPAASREAQKSAYPKVQPALIDMEPGPAYQLALRLARERGWRIVDSSPPSLRDPSARIDALDRSRFFGFPVDIAIRITPLANATRLDMRSVSRVGAHDFGANAERIEAFTAEALDVAGRP